MLISNFTSRLLLSAVLYAFINISRDVAKYFIYPYQKDKHALPIVIYGSGKSAKALLDAFSMNDPLKNVIAIYDDSPTFKNLQINNVPIISKFKNLEKLKESIKIYKYF